MPSQQWRLPGQRSKANSRGLDYNRITKKPICISGDDLYDAIRFRCVREAIQFEQRYA